MQPQIEVTPELMDCSSDDSSELSDSQVDDSVDKYYLFLKTEEKLKLFSTEDTYRCPFCTGKKERNFKYEALLQHATAIGASNRTAKERAAHNALSRFLRNDIENAVCPSLQLKVSEPATISMPDQDDQFVLPWMGVLVNVPTEFKNGKHVGGSGSKLKEKLSNFNPLKVIPIWNYKGHTGNAIVDFRKDWNGFKDAMNFEHHFEAEHLGKKDWDEGKDFKPEIHGWVARANDYRSMGPIGDYLRRKGDLKTITDLPEEELRKMGKLVSDLQNTVDTKTMRVQDLEMKYSESRASLDNLIQDMGRWLKQYEEDLKRMRALALEHSRRILDDNQNLKTQLDTERKELDLRSQQLDKLVNDVERKKLEEEKKKNALATLEQEKADQNVLRLMEEQKKETDEAQKKILQLEKQLDAKQKLEREIQQLKGNLEVMGCMVGGDGDLDAKEKMEKMSEELQDKIEEKEALEDLSNNLLRKQRTSNDELQDARKELIQGFEDCASRNFGVKKLGELDIRPFKKACKQRYSQDEVDLNATLFFTEWQEHLKNPDWHPIMNITVDGRSQDIIKEDDDKLVSLKEQLGDEVYNAVTTAITEVNKYKTSGVKEFWNFKENRRGTLAEGVEYILKQWATKKRKRAT